MAVTVVPSPDPHWHREVSEVSEVNLEEEDFPPQYDLGAKEECKMPATNLFASKMA